MQIRILRINESPNGYGTSRLTLWLNFSSQKKNDVKSLGGEVKINLDANDPNDNGHNNHYSHRDSPLIHTNNNRRYGGHTSDTNNENTNAELHMSMLWLWHGLITTSVSSKLRQMGGHAYWMWAHADLVPHCCYTKKAAHLADQQEHTTSMPQCGIQNNTLLCMDVNSSMSQRQLEQLYFCHILALGLLNNYILTIPLEIPDQPARIYITKHLQTHT